MCRESLVLLVVFFLSGCAISTGTPDNPIATAEENHSTMPPLEDLAAEFRRLRKTKGHFGGGTWNNDVDSWMGRKHQLMIELGTRLGTGDYGKAEIITLLGSPDVVAREGDDLFDQINNLLAPEESAASSHEFLIYYWRGTHDFLYFTYQGENVIDSGWWYAGEQ